MKELIQCASEARRKSYCPYSHFAVGAALEAADGTVFTGCNIENAAFSPTCCAERTAFFKAVSSGTTTFRRIVIIGGKKDDKPERTVPCGVCLQVMLEFCEPDEFEVILARSPEEYEVYHLKDFLPQGFRLTERNTK